MAIADLVAKANSPEFYAKVGFIAMRVAQNVAAEDTQTADHAVRAAYAQRIFRGEDNLPLIAAHIISSNGTIAATIEGGGEPPDGDIEFAFATIWTARSKAFAEE